HCTPRCWAEESDRAWHHSATMSPPHRGQRSELCMLAQLRAAASIDSCCVTASTVPIDTSLSEPPVYFTPFITRLNSNEAFSALKRNSFVMRHSRLLAELPVRMFPTGGCCSACGVPRHVPP